MGANSGTAGYTDKKGGAVTSAQDSSAPAQPERARKPSRGKESCTGCSRGAASAEDAGLARQ